MKKNDYKKLLLQELPQTFPRNDEERAYRLFPPINVEPIIHFDNFPIQEDRLDSSTQALKSLLLEEQEDSLAPPPPTPNKGHEVLRLCPSSTPIFCSLFLKRLKLKLWEAKRESDCLYRNENYLLCQMYLDWQYPESRSVDPENPPSVREKARRFHLERLWRRKPCQFNNEEELEEWLNVYYPL